MSKKAFRGLIAIVVVIVLLAVAWVAGWKITGQMNPVKWGKKGVDTTQTEADKTEVLAISEDGKKLLTGNSYAMPRAMAFVNKQSTYSKSKEFNVTATLSNQYINGKFDWSVEFVNPASEWATGKVAEYYVQANPTADGSATATIKYISSFSEPIKVTATLRGSEQSDSCQIDCLKQMDMVSCWLDTEDFGDYIEGGCELESNADGTIKADYRVWYAHFEVDPSFIDAVKSYLKFDIDLHGYSFASEIDRLCIEEESDNRLQLSFLNSDSIVSYADFIENFEAFDDEHKEAVYYAWYHAVLDVGGLQFEFGVQGYVNGVETTFFTSGEHNWSGTDLVYLSGARYGANVQPSVTLNQNVIF